MTIDNIGKVTFFPAKFNVKSSIQFGFEVNQPAYPQHSGGQLQLTIALVDKITSQQR